MYNISDRSIRGYRQKSRAGKPFHIFLKTKDGPVDIYVDSGGYASQRNKDTGNFDLGLGDASQIIRLIASGKTLPVPKPSWFVKDKTSEEALRPVAGYEVVSDPVQQGDLIKQGDASSRPVSAPKAARIPEHVAASALSLVAAYKSGARKFRKYDDSLYEREDGVLVWKFKVWRQEDKHWHVIDTVTIALFTPNGIEFPPEGRQYRAVVSRRSLLAPERSEVK